MAFSLSMRSVLAAAALVAVSSSAQAQTSLSNTIELQRGVPGAQINYLSFEVLVGGTFSIYTNGPTVDPVLYLLQGSPGAFTILDSNDDGCPFSLCGPAGSFSNSLITTFLAPGLYTAAGTDLTVAYTGPDVLSNLNSGTNPGLRNDGPFTVNVTSEQGVAFASNVTATPEPATVALLGTGLLGVAGIARRRRALQG